MTKRRETHLNNDFYREASIQCFVTVLQLYFEIEAMSEYCIFYLIIKHRQFNNKNNPYFLFFFFVRIKIYGLNEKQKHSHAPSNFQYV